MQFIPTKPIFLAVIMIGAPLVATPVMASKTGAFIGGLVTARVLTNMQQRTEAEQQQAYYAQQNAMRMQQQPMQQPMQQQAAAPMTLEQKLAQLDKLAAGGYVTPDEYKARKKALIDGQ